MEYFLGALLAMLAIAVARPAISHSLSATKRINIRYTQSYNYSILSPWEVHSLPTKEVERQSIKHYDSLATRVVLTEDRAYWISNNQFMTAEIIDGKINEESTKRVDTMSIDSVELENMIFIVDKLTEGNSQNENPNPGNK